MTKKEALSNNLITLITYTYSTEAYVLVAKLEAEGIECFLKNENILSTQQFLSNAVGGLDVQVRKTDYKNAKAILKTVEENKEASAAHADAFGKQYEKVVVYCPECESTNVYRKKAVFLSFSAQEHVCIDCSHKWKE